jgi:predicted O-methyltransferase YrrM
VTGVLSGRILELGTGVGVGLRWIAYGLGGRSDVAVESVENDQRTAMITAESGWSGSVRPARRRRRAAVARTRALNLIFADAPGGKWSGLDLSIAALAPGGVLLVDDMDRQRYTEPEHRVTIDGIRRTLSDDQCLVTTELPVGSGLILATRRIA